MKHLIRFSAILLVLQSCTAAAFDKAQPTKSKPLTAFPREFKGTWKSDESTILFYVDQMQFDDTSVTYTMAELSEGESSLTLGDSVQLRKMKGGYVFGIAGDNLWLNYVVKFPSKNELVVYGFDDEAKNYVAKYDEEDSEQGIVFVRYYATDREWENLLKSKALKEFRRFRRVS